MKRADDKPTKPANAHPKPIAEGPLTVREIAEDEKLWDEFFKQNPPEFQSRFAFISVEARIEAVNQVLQTSGADGAAVVDLKGKK